MQIWHAPNKSAGCVTACIGMSEASEQAIKALQGYMSGSRCTCQVKASAKMVSEPQTARGGAGTPSTRFGSWISNKSVCRTQAGGSKSAVTQPVGGRRPLSRPVKPSDVTASEAFLKAHTLCLVAANKAFRGRSQGIYTAPTTFVLIFGKAREAGCKTAPRQGRLFEMW